MGFRVCKNCAKSKKGGTKHSSPEPQHLGFKYNNPQALIEEKTSEPQYFSLRMTLFCSQA